MGEAGVTYAMPDGARYKLLTPGAAVGGEYVEFEWIFDRGVFAPPPHVHPSQVEDYEVLEGSLDVLIGDEWQTLLAGESASVPVGVTHTFRRPKAFVRVRNFHRPALGFEDFIETCSRTFAAGGVRRLADPRVPIYLAQAWRAHPETLREARARDRFAMGTAAAIGRALRMQLA
jgi:mannose-6-phosphate isomerase-like protein (cupin superfamily)